MSAVYHEFTAAGDPSRTRSLLYIPRVFRQHHLLVTATGPGSFAVASIDALYALSSDDMTRSRVNPDGDL